MSKTVQEILDELSSDEYTELLGVKSANPLNEAFIKRRPDHPNAGGSTVLPPMHQKIWKNKMDSEGSVKNKKVAYIHIPFCQKLCTYCGFFQNYANEDRETMYIDRLIKQLEIAKQYRYVQESLIHCVFFGGGTPSTLSPYNAERLLKAVNECLPLANDCEITMEACVSDLIDEKLQVWFKYGVNRISIGVQSFDTQIRQCLGRTSPKEIVIENLNRAASYNQAVIIVDLIYGLPYQTVGKFIDDLKIIDDLLIDGMDLYQLNVFEKSLLKKSLDTGKLPPVATSAQQAEYLKAATEFLEEAGYKRLSVCHWAKSNRERSLYNTLAKTNADVIPFGSGAGGFVGDISVYLQRDLKKYMEAIDKDKTPIMFMMRAPELSALYKDIQDQTETCGVNLTKLAKKYNPELIQLEAVLDIWVKHGLFTKKGHMYKMTIAGQYWQKNITQGLIEITKKFLNTKTSINEWLTAKAMNTFKKKIAN